MAKRKWKDFSPRTRGLIIIGGILDGMLKSVALVDLVRRPSSEIRGSKTVWASAIVGVNSVGVVPIVYFARGRRR